MGFQPLWASASSYQFRSFLRPQRLLGHQQAFEAWVVHGLRQGALHGRGKGIGHVFAGAPGIPAGIEAVAVFHLQRLAVARHQRQANPPACRAHRAEGELVDAATNRHRRVAGVGLGQKQLFLQGFAHKLCRPLAQHHRLLSTQGAVVKFVVIVISKLFYKNINPRKIIKLTMKMVSGLYGFVS